MSPPRKEAFPDLVMLARELYAEKGTKAAVIRYLHHEMGYQATDIARAMGIKYQHVRNVVNRPLKRNKEQNNGT